MNQKGFAPILILVGILVLSLVGGGVYYFGKIQPAQINSFIEECKREGYKVLESYPPLCQTAEDGIFKVGQKIPTKNNTNPTPTDTGGTADWKIWRNDNLNYEFKYPSDWEVGDSELGSSTWVIQQLQKKYYIEIGSISLMQQSRMGINICDLPSSDKVRCETVKIDKDTNAQIDWGDDDLSQASVSIGKSNIQGLITFQLSPVNSETKEILYKILSTFKFN